MYYRLIKPNWAKPFIKNTGTPNPEFVKEIDGPDVIEGLDLSDDIIKQHNQQGYNVYFFPNHPAKEINGNIQGRDIDVWNYVFIDMDLKDGIYKSKQEFIDKIKHFPLKPTLAIDSGNGVHVYWAIKDLNRDGYIETQFRLIDHFKTDDSVWKLCQLMRYPGTLNTKKHDKFIEVLDIVEISGGEQYTLNDLQKHLPPLDQKSQFKINVHLSKADGTYKPEFEEVKNDMLPEKFLDLVKNDENIYNLFYHPKETKGDRSKADMSLCNKLFSNNFTRQEAFQIMLQTDKARSYPGNKEDYAGSIVDKVFKDRPKFAGRTVADRRANNEVKALGDRLQGPAFIDATIRGWRKKQIIGLIAAEGVGKTSLSLNIFKEIIENNPDKDELFIYFSLEMEEEEIIEKWEEMVGKNSLHSQRLIVIANEDDQGHARDIGPQQIYWAVRETEQVYSKKVAAISIDHIGALSHVVDVTKKPNFNLVANNEMGWGNERTLPEKQLSSVMKALAKELNVLVLLQSQTTKEKGGMGDIPINGNAAYGVSHFNWFCDQVFTMWQPLRRVHKHIDLRVTAFQFVKIRGMKKGDSIQLYHPRLVAFDLDTCSYRLMTVEEKEEFNTWIKEANKLRAMDAKKQQHEDAYEAPTNVPKLKAIIRRFGDSKNNE